MTTREDLSTLTADEIEEERTMKCNVGKTDRLIRASIGTIIAAAGIYYESWWGLIALVPLLTAAFCFCPLYTLLNISTCQDHKTGS